jgi:hypothetical protein
MPLCKSYIDESSLDVQAAMTRDPAADLVVVAAGVYPEVEPAKATAFQA